MCRDVCFAGDEFVSEAARQKTSQFPSVTTLFWKTITGSWVCFTAALTTGRNLGWWKEGGVGGRSQPEVFLRSGETTTLLLSGAHCHYFHLRKGQTPRELFAGPMTHRT